jgi:hypothetical protein
MPVICACARSPWAQAHPFRGPRSQQLPVSAASFLPRVDRDGGASGATVALQLWNSECASLHSLTASRMLGHITSNRFQRWVTAGQPAFALADQVD